MYLIKDYNWIGWLIVLLLFCKYIWMYFLQQKGNTNPAFQARLLKYFSQEQISQGRRYTARHRKLSFYENLIHYPIMGIFLFAGLSFWLENSINQWTSYLFLQVALFFAIVFAFSQLISMPLDYYRNFVIEKQEGFNRQSLPLWLTDILKEYILSLFLVSLIFSLILLVMQWLPQTWWLGGSIAVIAFTLFLTYFAPIWIMPLFNKFTTLPDGELKQLVLNLAHRAKIHVNGVFLMDASKRSNHSNAFFTGLGKSKRVVLFDTLLEKHSNGEILSIIAHEMGHWRKGHIWKGTLVTIIMTFAMFGILYWASHWPLLKKIVFFDKPASITFLISTIFFIQFFNIFFVPINAYRSRKQEWQADSEALKLYPNGKDQADMMKKLVLENKGDVLGHPWIHWYQATHPHPLERIEFAYTAAQNQKNVGL